MPSIIYLSLVNRYKTILFDRFLLIYSARNYHVFFRQYDSSKFGKSFDFTTNEICQYFLF